MGFKDYARKTLSKLVLTHHKEILNKIKQSNVNIVSFDIFDTLIKRHVQDPVDVFAILEMEYKKSFNKTNPIAKHRIEAEKRARELSRYEEVTLNEIYDQFVDVVYDEKKWLIEKEIYLERQLCVANRNLLSVYNWCKDNGIKIVIISDMYLPKKVIEEILINAGYCGWSDLFVSSEIRKQKSTGNLFTYVLTQLKVRPEDILHIGDSLKADYLMPSKKNFKSILIPRSCELSVYQSVKSNSLSFSLLECFISNNIYKFSDKFQQIGYCILGPLLLGYSEWLHKKLHDKHINKLFFLAREGALLNRAFGVLYPNSGVRHCLIRVSRKATALPRMSKAKDLDELLSLFVVSRANFTLHDLFLACGLDENNEYEIINLCGCSSDKLVSSLTESERDNIFLYLKPHIDEISLQQEQNIIDYLSDLGFSGNIAVADVGWHGTIQEALQDIFPSVGIEGFYIGTKHKKNVADLENTSAYLFDKNKNIEYMQEIMFSVGLFEMLFLSTDGSTKCYARNEFGDCYPVLSKPEQTDYNSAIIENLQEAAIVFLQDVKKNSVISSFEFDDYALYSNYQKLVNPPRFETINTFKQFSFLDVSETTLLPSKKSFYYFCHPLKLKDDFLNSACKMFFLKCVFKIQLPYFNILCLLKKFDK